MTEAEKREGGQFHGDDMSIIFAFTTERGNALVENVRGPYHSVNDLKKANSLKSGGAYGKAVPSAYFEVIYLHHRANSNV